MSKSIILTEQQMADIYTVMMKESISDSLSDKVLMIKNYLDRSFARANFETMGEDGQPVTKPIVAWLDSHKQIIKNLDDKELFYIVQDKFKNIISDKVQRDAFLKRVIIDWYDHKITDGGVLSDYSFIK
jgi:hypothetical protein